MTKLREIVKYPSFLEKAGFTVREESTSDAVRWIWFEKTIKSDVTFILQVEFELCITESMEPELYNPFTKLSDNESYYFNGVYLKIVEGDSVDWADESGDEGVSPTFQAPSVRRKGRWEIDHISLNVDTWAQLRSLCKMLGCKD